jgi:hypothetical protein
LIGSGCLSERYVRRGQIDTAPTPEPVQVPAGVVIEDVAGPAGFQDYALAGWFKRGRGCTVVDLDLDGRPDVFLSNPEDESYVLLNKSEPGTLRFEPAVEPYFEKELIWHAVPGDYDNDGDPDLFVTVGGLEGIGYDKLLRNEWIPTGTLSFSDASVSAGIQGPLDASRAVTRSASTGGDWIDYDNDGHLDFFVNGGIVPPQLYHVLPDGSLPGRNQLWRNNGDGTFTDMAYAVGLQKTAPSRFSTWIDIDNDGDLDLFENVWKFEANSLWRNQLAETGQATFTDITDFASLDGGDLGYPLESFVSAAADFNNDGSVDSADLGLLIAAWGCG